MIYRCPREYCGGTVLRMEYRLFAFSGRIEVEYRCLLCAREFDVSLPFRIRPIADTRMGRYSTRSIHNVNHNSDLRQVV